LNNDKTTNETLNKYLKELDNSIKKDLDKNGGIARSAFSSEDF